MTEKIQEKEKNGIMEACGFCAIFLTVLGQCLIMISYLAGNGCWLVANALYLLKAVKQDMGKAEIVRNVTMTAITTGLMVVYWFTH